MICHRFKTIFVHVPKTGGQSVEQIFFEKVGLTWETCGSLLMRENRDPRLGPEQLAHLYAREYIEFGHIPPVDFESYFKFAIVRNPYDRLVSEYKFAVAPTGITFTEFVLERWPRLSWLDRRRHVEPQWKFLYSGEELLLDAVLRFENLAVDMPVIFERIFGERIALPHVNASTNSRPWQDFYTPKTKARVRDFYETDFKRFGYPS